MSDWDGRFGTSVNVNEPYDPAEPLFCVCDGCGFRFEITDEMIAGQMWTRQAAHWAQALHKSSWRLVP